MDEVLLGSATTTLSPALAVDVLAALPGRTVWAVVDCTGVCAMPWELQMETASARHTLEPTAWRLLRTVPPPVDRS